MSEQEAGSAGESAATGRVCPVALCPVGMLLTTTGQVRPEVVEHLMKAGRELMLALSSVLNARVEDSSEPAVMERVEVE